MKKIFLIAAIISGLTTGLMANTYIGIDLFQKYNDFNVSGTLGSENSINISKVKIELDTSITLATSSSINGNGKLKIYLENDFIPGLMIQAGAGYESFKLKKSEDSLSLIEEISNTTSISNFLDGSSETELRLNQKYQEYGLGFNIYKDLFLLGNSKTGEYSKDLTVSLLMPNDNATFSLELGKSNLTYKIFDIDTYIIKGGFKYKF